MNNYPNEREAVILSAARTPVGRFMGQLSGISAPDLGALAVREALARSDIDPVTVYEVIMGIVVSSAAGQAPARQAALRGGLGDTVGAMAVNKVCGSGLKAVMLAANAIAAGEADVFGSHVGLLLRKGTYFSEGEERCKSGLRPRARP